VDEEQDFIATVASSSSSKESGREEKIEEEVEEEVEEVEEDEEDEEVEGDEVRDVGDVGGRDEEEVERDAGWKGEQAPGIDFFGSEAPCRDFPPFFPKICLPPC
jgi:hypothetical protein